MTPEFLPVGDRGVRAAFGDEISPRLLAQITRFCRALEADPPPGVTEWVPGYGAVTVYYRPWETDFDALCGALARRARRGGGGAAHQGPQDGPRLVEVPVSYGGAFGPDLDDVARLQGLSPDEVVRRHSAPRYLVHFLGFLPGFAYLGGLPPSLATPRRDSPRASVPAGAVGIGGAQTGIYPIETPGGWHLLGRTPLRLFDPNRQPPALLRAGDRVRFVPISAREYEEGDATNGTD